jgi:hypothetical protein
VGFSPAEAPISLPRGLVGGGGGIRTHEGLSSLPVFKTGAFNHSATPPLPYKSSTYRFRNFDTTLFLSNFCPLRIGAGIPEDDLAQSADRARVLRPEPVRIDLQGDGWIGMPEECLNLGYRGSIHN